VSRRRAVYWDSGTAVHGRRERRFFFYIPAPHPLCRSTIRVGPRRPPAMGGRLVFFVSRGGFRLGVAVGRFALELDCPLDARPVFAPSERCAGSWMGCDGVTRVYLYPAGLR
jgi:hypothetical protein